MSHHPTASFLGLTRKALFCGFRFSQTLLLLSGVFLSASTAVIPTQAAAQSPVEEIVVTAQRRAQRVQDVPISISAFGGDELREVRALRPRDIAELTPGLFFNSSSISEADPEFTVRGIGTNDAESNQNPAMSLYVDGVPVQFNAMVGHTMFDLERVEVLKGPQGTLYGRNTTAGAMNFITKKPDYEWGGYFTGSFGEFNRTDLEGAVNLPVSDNFAVRLAGKVNLQKGWQTIRPFEAAQPTPGRRDRDRDIRNGDVEREAFRATVRWEPTDRFEVLTTFDAGFDNSDHLLFSHSGNVRQDDPGELCIFGTEGIRDETQCASFARDSSTAKLIPVMLAGQQFLVQDLTDPDGPGDLVTVSDTDGEPRTIFSSFAFGKDIDAEAYGITHTMNWRAERFTATSVTGYRDFDRKFGSARAGPFLTGDLLRTQELEIFTQEVRISSNETWENLTWVAGAFFAHEEVFDISLTDFSEHSAFSAIFQSTRGQETDAIAGFGQAEYTFAEKWTLIGGVRFTSEERDFNFHGEVAGFGPTPVDFFEDSVESTEVTWRAGLNFQPNRDMLFYASASKGFRGKGFPATIAFSEPQLFPFDEEQLFAYEAGFKTTLLDGNLRFNGAVYYYDWQNFQAQTAVDREGIRLIVLANAGDARSIGAETALQWTATEELSFSVGASWMDAEIVSGDLDDNDLARAPDVMLNGKVRFDSAEEYSGFRPFVQIDFTYNDKVQFIIPNHPGATQDGYFLLNARAGITLPDPRWKISIWGENITHKLYRAEVFGPGSTFLPGRTHFGPPSMFGGTVSYSF